MLMLEKVRQYFDEQYNYLVKCLERKKQGQDYEFTTEKELVNETITKCSAVAQFSQIIGVKYEDVNKMYKCLKKSCENLLTNSTK